jgi:hypothetical protein
MIRKSLADILESELRLAYRTANALIFESCTQSL